MKTIKYLILFTLLNLSHSHANEIQFPTITQNEFANMSEEFLGNFTHTSVSGASSLGAIFGFEVGILAGVTQAGDLEEIIQRADSTFDQGYLPHAGLLGRVTIPFGVTFEATVFPTIKTSGAEFSQMSGGVQWDFFSLPLVNVAAKVHFSKGDFKLDQDIGTDPNGNLSYDHTIFGAQVLASLNALIIEPYAGIGFARGKSELDFSATAGNNLFAFTDARSASYSKTSPHLLVGANLNLLLVNLGLEYANVFGTSRVTGKFTLGF
jgi:hypothetical protein